MKNLKLILSAMLMLMVSSAAISQGIGIRAGVNFQNINGKDEFNNSLKNDLVTGYHVGLVGEIGIAPTFYLQPGILFTTKGTVSKDEVVGQSLKNTLSLGYLEVPINLVFKPAIGNGHIILGFGPYIAYGVNGKVKTKAGGNSQDFDVTFTNTVESSDNQEDFYVKRIDSGANLFFGYEFAGNFSIQLNTQLGMVNISPKYAGFSDDTKWNHTGFGLSAGYRFGS